MKEDLKPTLEFRRDPVGHTGDGERRMEELGCARDGFQMAHGSRERLARAAMSQYVTLRVTGDTGHFLASCPNRAVTNILPTQRERRLGFIWMLWPPPTLRSVIHIS